MVEIVNLNRARKVQTKAKARVEGAANARKFGRSKAEKTLEQTQADKARATLDGHAREPE